MSATRKLLKLSRSSFGVVIPKKLIRKYGWREHQKLEIVDKGRGKLELRDWPRR